MNSGIFGELVGKTSLDEVPLAQAGFFPGVLATYLAELPALKSVSSDKEMSQLLELLLDKAIADFDWEPEPQEGSTESSLKWRYSSGYQKAVRRNDPSIMRAGLMLNACDPAYIWRRAATIAIEDVSVGDPWVCAVVVAACRYVRSRKMHGADRLAVFLGKLMGAAVKDRSSCDGYCLHIYHPRMLPIRNDVERMSIQQRADIFRSDAKPFSWRISAGMSLIGPRYDGFIGAGGSPDLFFEVLQGMVPYSIWWTSRSYAKMARDGMFVSYPLIWRQLTAGLKPEIGNSALPERCLIDGVLAATYDGHVREGRRAISYFCKSCDEMAKFLVKNPEVSSKAVTMAVFTVDSSVLDRFLKSPWAASLYRTNMEGEILASGISREQALELLGIIARNRGKLNYCRSKGV